MNEFISRLKNEKFLIKFMSENLVSVNEKNINISIVKVDDKSFNVLYGNKIFNCRILGNNKNHYEIFINNTKYQIDCKTKSELMVEELNTSKSTTEKKKVVSYSPMPGLILKILKTNGAVVRKGEPLLILEAMKMENEILAPVDGQLNYFDIKEGETIEKNSKLFEIK